MWMDAIEQRGGRVRLTDAGRVLTISKGRLAQAWHIRRPRRAPRPSEVERAPVDSVLWLASTTPALRHRLLEAGASWVTDAGEVHLKTRWGTIAIEPITTATEPPIRPTSGLSRGGYAVLQILLERAAPLRQQDIAHAVGLSQPRISQILREFIVEGLVRRQAEGWQVVEVSRALDRWLAADFEPVPLTTSWYSLDPPADQLVAVKRLVNESSAAFRLCGDWAADILAPWRPPRLVTVHVDRSLDLDDAGFVPATNDTATLLVHLGSTRPDWRPDPTVLAQIGVDGPYDLAPVTEVMRELQAAGGPDTEHAIAELRRVWLHARTTIARGSP